MRKFRDYLDEGNLVVRQGQQVWHVHQALKTHDEASYIGQLAKEYHAAGRVQTVAEGMVLAGAVITAYRSNESGERVPQRARARLDEELANQNAVRAQLKHKGA
ncbi:MULTISPECIES: hypothetical protein [Achromobacter]|uniref:Uncharacterized protein n=1 Tax=Achromobacter spanius TaxID=217203 RepID=A0AA42S7G0_9BURK|nr:MULTISPECIES: hypothetical protein [Achromobacter]KNE24868.1 hypothetical protein AFM18_23870 [Achromobacter spanius]MDH0740350.1 hypothetical protein [Achromobacter spanius]RSE74836.1 hypothetical protein EGU64_32230 [Achromobacter denitrificans]